MQYKTLEAPRQQPEPRSRALRTAVKNKMKKALFHNFTDTPFTGYWDGKAYTFNPGVKKYYPAGIAAHFAKHLTNKVLNEKGLEVYTSPKKPEDTPQFMDIFNKAYIPQTEVEGQDDLEIAGNEVEGPSMNIKTKPGKVVDPYDARNNPVGGPGDAPQIIAGDETDEYEDEKTDEK